ncbi:hypothetical protein RSSM_03907 [Rhodopirellula sallentina SM41]|uniref:Uncharacterized protein n=1 Tax=Rhodopirellula sallentina SM41 TaxID=1263870 RepID=M5TZM0_9BACT|nr:hypothetical protein RSSM_03907 [Rhodopirellula sallentina SM41]
MSNEAKANLPGRNQRHLAVGLPVILKPPGRTHAARILADKPESVQFLTRCGGSLWHRRDVDAK